jgi:hypothetical protein
MLKKSHDELFVGIFMKFFLFLQDYCEYSKDMEIYKMSLSMLGKFRKFLAQILSVYCVYRLVIVKLQRDIKI